MMERRGLSVLCVQETKWKGTKAKKLGGGFKLYYCGVDGTKNGVGIVLESELVDKVVEVNRVSERLMWAKLIIEVGVVIIVSAYAPQMGCEEEEKQEFWKKMDKVMAKFRDSERVVIGADFNGHVGEGNSCFEHIAGKFGFRRRQDHQVWAEA